jgi:AraC-like DNA-binding protein
MATMFVNPLIKHAILVEPTRIVGRTLESDGVAIEVSQPISRLLGGYVAYFSTELPFAVDRGRGWEQGRALVLVQPYQQHRLRRCHGLRTILIEPESVCPAMMDDHCWTPGTASNARWIATMQRGFDEWERLAVIPDRSVDQLVFGRDLPSRTLDPRIAAATDIIARHPSGAGSSVTALARHAGISPSRLSHLFREEVGIPIRSFRAWKRIRNSMALAANEPVLLNAALDAGYADEPHYSRSMRKYFGQRAHLMQRHWRDAMTFRGLAAEKADSTA